MATHAADNLVSFAISRNAGGRQVSLTRPQTYFELATVCHTIASERLNYKLVLFLISRRRVRSRLSSPGTVIELDIVK